MSLAESPILEINNALWANGHSTPAGEKNPTIDIIKESLAEKKLLLIIGPCALQSLEQMVEHLTIVNDWLEENNLPITVFHRVPHEKPRTAPVSKDGKQFLFNGIGKLKAQEILSQLLQLFPGTRFAAEAMSPEDIEELHEQVALWWIGARTILDRLVAAIGRSAAEHAGVLIVKNPSDGSEETHRGMLENAALGSPAHIGLDEEKPMPILRNLVIPLLRGRSPFTAEERGVWRNVSNASEASKIKDGLAQTPTIVDVSHLLRKEDLDIEKVLPLIIEAILSGADGVMIETHTENHPSLTDKGVNLMALLSVLPEIVETYMHRKALSGKPTGRG
jgi:phospho-2-dehydro-3-deoxyheptonate aldolase